MTFFQKVNALFSKVVTWFSNLLTRNDAMVKRFAPIAIDVLNGIKTANSCGAADALGLILSGIGAKWGTPVMTLVEQWITDNIDKVISAVGIAGSAAQARSVSDKIRLVSDYISTLSIDVKGVRISEVAAMLAKDLADSHLSLVEIIAIVTAIYKTE